MSKPNYIGLYGTLRFGGPANGLLRGCKRVGIDHIYGTLYNLGAFPGVKLQGKNIVTIDVYELPLESPEEVLQRLDRYEGYIPGHPDQSLYTRLKTETLLNLKTIEIYEYQHPIHEDLEIVSGDWFNQGGQSVP